VRAAWYGRQGPAAEVLSVGELPTPEPGRGAVRVRITLSGVNPGDVKKRQGWLGSAMAFPRVVPHSDGAGVVDAVGQDVDAGWIGRRVWVYGAQSYRSAGTAAEYTVVPTARAVELPDAVPDEVGASLGIPGITATGPCSPMDRCRAARSSSTACSVRSAPWRRSWHTAAGRP
jgi:NADPH2:quinone reductase